ncbi:restriction endonuclease subunit S [Veillonella parvula]|uniref:restriction endonuclease subunit S n=1 Tax=Veillonella parvula TaxID=29466 RepID=UPI000796B387|nr:restriction endonuclease subunit S [Veillonella parvula]KXB85934.1 type I restriction modification DNA specificity domain protein [Veillonella parvula]
MEYKRLSDCAFWGKDRTDNINYESYISTENMIKDKGGVTIASSLPDSKTASAYRPNDILLSNIRPYFRKIWYADKNGSCSNDVLVVRANEDIDSKFLYYVLSDNNFFNYDTVTSKGTKMPRGTQTAIMKYLVPDINIGKQRKIANILSTYDNLIENNNKRIKLLEQMTESLYKEWFVRFRFPGYEDVEFIDGFPKDWEKVKLDDVLNKIATGLNPRKNFVLGEGENFYVTIKNMADNTVYLDDRCDKVNDDAIIKINKRSDLKIGDLLFSGIGTIGRVCLIDISTNNWNISESVFTMRANKKISSEFLYMLLLSQDVQNYCQSKANGSAQKGIRMGDLRKYTFLLPTKNVINDFTNQISPILRNVSLLRNENKNLIQQRDMLLPRLMSGKLEV